MKQTIIIAAIVLLGLGLIFSWRSESQTHTFPALDTNNTFTGINNFGVYNTTGAGTHSGTETFANINGKVYADQQAGADLCAKLVSAMNALPAAGGTVDATGFLGAQSCASNATLSKNNVTYLFGPNVTISVTAGVQILVSGSDVQLLGSGDTTVWDFSSGTSGTAPFLIRNSSTGNNRVTLSNFKIIGNRIAGGTAGTLIACSATVGTIDRCIINHMILVNASAHGIILGNATNAEISYNNISSSGLSGIFLDTTGAGHRVLYNIITDSNLQNVNGDGSIMARDAGVAGNQKDVQVIGNFVKQTTTALGNAVGIGMNGVAGLVVAENTVYQTTGSGEGIAATGINVKIYGNQTFTNAGAPAACGILFYGGANYSPDSISIFGNTVKDGSPGLCVAWGANNVNIQNVNIFGNRSYGNQNYGFQSFSGFTGMIATNINIFDNDFTGNVLGPISLLTTGVTGIYNVWNNIPLPTANPTNGSNILGQLDGVYGTYRVTADQTITAGALANIPGLSWTMPPNTAINAAFSCHLLYNETTAATSMQFGIQDVTVAPTSLMARAQLNTSATAFTAGNVPALTTTTATAIVTATPSAATTVFSADISGMIEQPSNASASAVNIMAQFTTNNGTIKRGSFCRVW